MRIISLAPSITETIFALGSGDSLIGVTNHCNYPAQVNGIAKVGAFASPSIDEILRLNPDIIITTTFHKAEKLEPITSKGIKLYQIEGDQLLDAPKMIRDLGKAIGKYDVAHIMATDIETIFESLFRKASTMNKVTVCYLCTSTKFCGHKPLCHTNNLVEKLGGVLTDYNKDNLAESIVCSMPESIIIPYSKECDDYKIQMDFFENNAIFKKTPAYKNGRVRNMNGELLSRPGSRAAEGLKQLFELIHN